LEAKLGDICVFYLIAKDSREAKNEPTIGDIFEVISKSHAESFPQLFMTSRKYAPASFDVTCRK